MSHWGGHGLVRSVGRARAGLGRRAGRARAASGKSGRGGPPWCGMSHGSERGSAGWASREGMCRIGESRRDGRAGRRVIGVSRGLAGADTVRNVTQDGTGEERHVALGRAHAGLGCRTGAGMDRADQVRRAARMGLGRCVTRGELDGQVGGDGRGWHVVSAVEEWRVGGDGRGWPGMAWYVTFAAYSARQAATDAWLFPVLPFHVPVALDFGGKLIPADAARVHGELPVRGAVHRAPVPEVRAGPHHAVTARITVLAV
jgi:hypothetical protein